MNKLSRSLLGMSLVAACSCIAAAQETSQGNVSIPKVLQIMREYTKPGKSGMAHEKTESAFVQAMTRAKWPTHYLGMTSLSGKNRALFLTSYASFEAWEKDNAATREEYRSLCRTGSCLHGRWRAAGFGGPGRVRFP